MLSFGSHWMKFLLLPAISSVTYVMIDSGKSVFKISASMLVYSALHSWWNVGGIGVAVSGVVLYHSMKEFRREAKND